jgi:FlaA1/EpsC-like NDP-sugar epimerase
LYEELLNSRENTLPTHHPKIMIAKVAEYNYPEVKNNVEALVNLFEAQDNDAIVRKMKSMVPEYRSHNSIYEKLDKEELKH